MGFIFRCIEVSIFNASALCKPATIHNLHETKSFQQNPKSTKFEKKTNGIGVDIAMDGWDCQYYNRRVCVDEHDDVKLSTSASESPFVLTSIVDVDVYINVVVNVQRRINGQEFEV